MDNRYAPQPVAGWYIPAAVLSLLVMLLGLGLYLMHVAADPASLPVDQRAMFEAEPGWVSASLGAACGIGAVGAVLLMLRRRAAVPLMTLALIGAVVWFAGLFAVRRLRDLLTTNDIAAAVAVVAVAWTIYWFARHSRQRGWLR